MIFKDIGTIKSPEISYGVSNSKLWRISSESPAGASLYEPDFKLLRLRDLCHGVNALKNLLETNKPQDFVANSNQFGSWFRHYESILNTLSAGVTDVGELLITFFTTSPKTTDMALLLASFSALASDARALLDLSLENTTSTLVLQRLYDFEEFLFANVRDYLWKEVSEQNDFFDVSICYIYAM